MPGPNNPLEGGAGDHDPYELSEQYLNDYREVVAYSFPGYTGIVDAIFENQSLSTEELLERLRDLHSAAEERVAYIASTLRPEWLDMEPWKPTHRVPSDFDQLKKLSGSDLPLYDETEQRLLSLSQQFWRISHSFDRHIKIGATSVLLFLKKI